MPMAINWRDGEVKFNHDHLKAEMSDKPIGKALEWGIGQEHVKFGHSHVIPADNVVVILGRFVLTLGT